MNRAKRRAWVLFAGALATAAVVVWLAASLTPAAARTDLSDVETTRSYLRVEIDVYQALVTNLHRESAASEEVAARLASECPSVASGGPRNAGRGKLARESVYAVVIAFFAPASATIRDAVATLSHLHWTNRRLTRLVHAQAMEDATVLAPPPDVCGDWKSWIASGYKVVPPGTMRFLAAVAPASTSSEGEGLEELIAPLLRRYEGPRGASVHRHLEHLRRILQLRADSLVAATTKVEKGLGLLPPPPTPAGSPAELTIQPPPAVAQAGGARLSDFDLGRTVAAQTGCLACHRIGESGNRGPGADLTHIGSQLTGVQIARALRYPKPPMPPFRLLPMRKFNALVEFLALLR